MATQGPKDLDLAISELSSGGVVAFPTETVYGLGADATNPEAIAKIFAVKGRPPDHPLIVHISGADQLAQWSGNVPEAAYRLADHFWPGPLTLILPESKALPDVTGGQSSVGLRAPSHPVAQALIKGFGGGIAAPSANRFGRISPTRAAHVHDEFGDQVRIILEGGDCTVGLESTILSLSGPSPCLLRPGAIGRSALESILGQEIFGIDQANGQRASGLLASHYAPRTALQLMPTTWIAPDTLPPSSQIALVCITDFPPLPVAHRILMPQSPSDYGNRLYATLRDLDQGEYDLIIAETPPSGEAWAAIHDRLGRASHESKSPTHPPPDAR